jgi:hypothetical protein
MIQSTSRLPVYARVRPYQTLIDPQLRSWRLGATLFSAFGVLALGIATVGPVRGSSRISVSQRTQEIRRASGVRRLWRAASRGFVCAATAVRMASVGGMVGLALALAGGSVVQSMLFRDVGARASVMATPESSCSAVHGGGGPPFRRGGAARVSPMVGLLRVVWLMPGGGLGA